MKTQILERTMRNTPPRTAARRFVLQTAILAFLTPFIVGCVQTGSLLQGEWTVIAGEHGGKPMDAMNGGTLQVDGDRFRIDTSAGNVLEGVIVLDGSREPAVMVMDHDSGLLWEAIYEVDEETLQMNYVDADGPDPLPSTFRTSEDTEATVVVLERQGE